MEAHALWQRVEPRGGEPLLTAGGAVVGVRHVYGQGRAHLIGTLFAQRLGGRETARSVAALMAQCGVSVEPGGVRRRVLRSPHGRLEVRFNPAGAEACAPLAPGADVVGAFGLEVGTAGVTLPPYGRGALVTRTP